ncbi:MAG: OmpA family protein [Oligoflexales bacterium]
MCQIAINRLFVIQLLFGFALSLAAQTVYSDEQSSVRKFGKSEELHAYLGFGGGAIFSKSGNEEKEFSKRGYSLGLSGAFSRKTSSVLLEGIFGWRNSRILIDKKKDFEGTKDLEIRTDYFHMDLTPMLKINNDVWVGPLLSTTFGTDTTFSAASNESKPNFYIGIQGNYYSGKNHQHRVNLQFMTDVSIQGRQVYLLNLNYHIGMEVFSRPKYVVKTIYKKSKPVTKTKVEKIQKYQYLLDGGIINFPTGEFSIAANYQKYLTELSTLLKVNDSLWTVIFVRSHTDYRGGQKLNQELSKNRADAVISFFADQKINKERVKIYSNSFNDPVENNGDEIALAKNRRVEIIIVTSTSKNAVKLNQKLLNLKQRNMLPATCYDGVCQ